MLSDEKLLRVLATPGFHSGTDLGRLLGVSRVAIQKRIANLRKCGLPVLRVPGRGYSLEEGVGLLDKDIMLALISEEHRELISSLDLLQSVASTSDYLSGVTPSPGHAAVCISESQEDGRGRRGRQWVSTPYRNLMFSMCWCFDSWPHAITGISLAAGIEVVRALRSAGVDGVKIKWPNDLVIDRKKIAGILIDVRGEANSACLVVMGLGLNISLSRSDGRLIDQPWTDLHSEGYGKLDRNRIASCCIEAWINLCNSYQATGFGQYQRDWKEFDAYDNCDVKIISSKNEFAGRVSGVSELGELVVEVPDGSTRLLSDSDSSILPV